jgi:hypothetical protein
LNPANINFSRKIFEADFFNHKPVAAKKPSQKAPYFEAVEDLRNEIKN